jgi:hypothetical protein
MFAAVKGGARLIVAQEIFDSRGAMQHYLSEEPVDSIKAEVRSDGDEKKIDDFVTNELGNGDAETGFAALNEAMYEALISSCKKIVDSECLEVPWDYLSDEEKLAYMRESGAKARARAEERRKRNDDAVRSDGPGRERICGPALLEMVTRELEEKLKRHAELEAATLPRRKKSTLPQRKSSLTNQTHVRKKTIDELASGGGSDELAILAFAKTYDDNAGDLDKIAAALGDGDWLAGAKKNPPGTGVEWAQKMLEGSYV